MGFARRVSCNSKLGMNANLPQKREEISMGNAFELDLKKIRERARAQMKNGAVTPANTSDLYQVIAVLNQALATELVCVLRYKNHYYMARGIRGETVAKEFLEHAAEE